MNLLTLFFMLQFEKQIGNASITFYLFLDRFPFKYTKYQISHYL